MPTPEEIAANKQLIEDLWKENQKALEEERAREQKDKES